MMRPGGNPPRWWIEQAQRLEWDRLMKQARTAASIRGERVRVVGGLDGRGRWHYVVMASEAGIS